MYKMYVQVEPSYTQIFCLQVWVSVGPTTHIELDMAQSDSPRGEGSWVF